MELRFGSSFEPDYKTLPRHLQVVVEKKLGMLLENPKHPSLRVKKMEGFDYIFEARITKGYRFTFQKKGDIYFIRRVGPHDILRHP